MKRALLVLLLMLATPAALPAPNLFQQLERCTEISIVYTRFATLASVTEDDQKNLYLKFVKSIADKSKAPGERELLIAVGDAAWEARNDDIKADALGLYDQCVQKMGTST